MEIRLRSTGEVMYESEFRTRFAQNLPPRPVTQEWLDSYISDPAGDIVFEGPQATGGTVYQYSQRSGVEQLDGKWYTKYILGPVFTDRAASEGQPAQTAAEQETAYKAMKDAEQATSVRNQRTQLLKDCDWTQIADSTADKTAWATYRQALRDITGQAGFPWTITWPNDPNWVAPTV
jgi:hypothetical protein